MHIMTSTPKPCSRPTVSQIVDGKMGLSCRQDKTNDQVFNFFLLIFMTLCSLEDVPFSLSSVPWWSATS